MTIFEFFLASSGSRIIILTILLGFLALVKSTYNIDTYLATHMPLSLWFGPNHLYVGSRDNIINRLDGKNQVAFAGNGDRNSPSAVSGPGAAIGAYFASVRGITGDTSERFIYLANTELNTIRAVDTSTGQIATIAGTGSTAVNGDGGPATSASVSWPTSVTIDSQNNIYTCSYDYPNQKEMTIRKIDTTTGIITSFLRLGDVDSGDGGAGTSAQIAPAKSIFIQNNKMYFGTAECHVRVVDLATNIITTIAGSTCAASDLGPGHYYYSYIFADSGDAVSALSAIISPNPTVTGSMLKLVSCCCILETEYLFPPTVDKNDVVFIYELHTCVVRTVDPISGIINTIAGVLGTCGHHTGTSALDAGPADSITLNQNLNNLLGIAVDATG